MDIVPPAVAFRSQGLARASLPDLAPPVSTARVTSVVAPPAPAPVDPERGTRFGEAAAADLPATVGWLIVASYVAILGAFAWAFFGAADVMFNIGVCAVYLAMYLGVPWVFLKAEPQLAKIKRPDFADFLERGLSTWTGHVSGGAALAQMLTIPVALTFAALGIGIIIRLSA